MEYIARIVATSLSLLEQERPCGKFFNPVTEKN